jgi:hypothetical protein
VRFTPRAAALAAAILFAAGASAEGSGSPTYTFSGFGTVGAVQSDSDLATYRFPTQEHGGSRDNVAFDVDSKLGAQVNANFGPTFSAIVQGQVRENFQGTWTPSIEWAFAKARLGASGVSVRVGRMGAPFFMVSDFRDVGYANTWVRPPLDVYGQVPFSHFDGADVLYQHTFGEVDLSAQLLAGTTKTPYSTFDMHGYGMTGFNASVGYGPLTFRAGYIRGTLVGQNPDLVFLDQQLHGAAMLTGLTDMATLGDALTLDHKKASFGGLGVTLDWHDIIANTEYTRRKIDGYPGDTSAWYATVGYRIGAWTPYVTHSQIRMDRQLNSDAIPALPPLLPLKGAVDYLTGSVAQSTNSIGARWDVKSNIDIKAQFDRISVPSGSAGLFSAVSPGFGGNDVNVYSLAVDFVF